MHASIVLDHFAHVHLVVIVPVQNTHMAQVIAPDIRVLNIGLSLHPLPYSVRYRVGGVCLVFNRLLDKAYGKAVAKSAVAPDKDVIIRETEAPGCVFAIERRSPVVAFGVHVLY